MQDNGYAPMGLGAINLNLMHKRKKGGFVLLLLFLFAAIEKFTRAL
jgi:hypothetical protein